MKVFATVYPILAIGKASGQHVYLSTRVRQCLFPSELGSGPTRSICTRSNLVNDGKKFAVGLITKRCLTSLTVVFIPGCAIPCLSAICRYYGLHASVDISQYTAVSLPIDFVCLNWSEVPDAVRSCFNSSSELCDWARRS